MPARPPRPAEDPLRDVEGTPIPLQCRVEQVAVEEKQGALRCRLHQQGLVIGRGIHLLYVRFDHENHGMIALRPHLVRVLDTPGHHRAPDTTRLPGTGVQSPEAAQSAATPTVWPFTRIPRPPCWTGVDYASIRYEPLDPPADVLAGMRAYLAAMDLRYGCFDLVATAAGILTYECNPAGAYGWLEQALDLPITSALADLLANGAHHGAHGDRRTEPGRAGAGPGPAG